MWHGEKKLCAVLARVAPCPQQKNYTTYLPCICYFSSILPSISRNEVEGGKSLHHHVVRYTYYEKYDFQKTIVCPIGIGVFRGCNIISSGNYR